MSTGWQETVTCPYCKEEQVAVADEIEVDDIFDHLHDCTNENCHAPFLVRFTTSEPVVTVHAIAGVAP